MTTHGPVIPDAAVEAAWQKFLQVCDYWDMEETDKQDMRSFLAAAYPFIRAAILAEVDAAMERVDAGVVWFDAENRPECEYESFADMLDAMKEADDVVE